MSPLAARFRYQLIGGHMHIRVFAGKSGCTYGKAGDLIFTEEEWARLENVLKAGSGVFDGMVVEIVPDEQ